MGCVILRLQYLSTLEAALRALGPHAEGGLFCFDSLIFLLVHKRDGLRDTAGDKRITSRPPPSVALESLGLLPV